MKLNHYYNLQLIISVLIFTFLLSCGGGGGGGTTAPEPDDPPIIGNIGTLSYSPATCSEEDQNEFIYDAMHDVYLWSAYTPELNPDNYATQGDLLSALRYSADTWSYTISQQEYNDYYAGANIGLGIKLAYSSVTNEIFITVVYPDSPADDAGLTRGYELISINGYSAYDIIQNDLWDEAFGPSEDGYVTDITFIDTNGQAGTASIVKTDYYAHSSPTYNIFTNDSNGKKIGYLLYLSFTSNYMSDLSSAMTAFENNNVKELIVDLRYNGGGQNSAARYLGSAIAGQSLLYEIMYYYLHNTQYSAWNRVTSFSYSLYDLNIEKVVFLVTSQTASASELLINSLSPYISSYLVGSKTHGKPVGMYAFSYCTNYLVPISFQMLNSSYFGNYFEGFSANCSASDDVTNQLGDENEAMLSTAINYLETNTCAHSRNTLNNLKHTKRGGIHKIFDLR